MISKSLAQKLGVKYIKSNSGKIKDVSGKIINNLGKCEKLKFKVEGIKPTFEIQPNILESMNDHVNLGSAFLQKNNTNIRLTRNGNFLKFNRLKPVQMVNSIKDSQTEQKSIKTSKKEEAKSMNDGKGKLICKHRVLLKPRCVTFINICSETQRKEIVTEPLNDTALCQVLPALYKNPKKVAVINESNEDVWLQKGSHIGHFENGTEVKYEDLKNCKVHEGIQEVKEQLADKIKDEPFNEKDEIYLSVIEGLKINENKLLKENPSIMEDVKKVLFRYRNVFSAPGDVENEIGLTNLIKFKVELKPDVQPKNAKPRPLNPDQRASLKAQIEKWKRQGQIIECDSPWAAPLVPAKKAGEVGVIRWAVDFRDINEKTISNSYPLLRISDNLENLEDQSIFQRSTPVPRIIRSR